MRLPAVATFARRLLCIAMQVIGLPMWLSCTALWLPGIALWMVDDAMQ